MNKLNKEKTNKIFKAIFRTLLDKSGHVDLEFAEYFTECLKNQGYIIVKRRNRASKA